MNKSILKNKVALLFVFLAAIFLTNALVAEFVGVKIFQMEDSLGLNRINYKLFGNINSLQYTAGVLLWPVVFIMTDVVNEYFGKKGVKLLSFLAVGVISYAFIMIYVVIALVPADWWSLNYQSAGVPNMQAAFTAVFGQGLFIIAGSLMAFLVGQLLDVLVYHRIRKVTGEGKVWLRATGSTLISQLVDSFVVLGIAFYVGPMLFPGNGTPWAGNQLLSIGLNNYFYKFIIAILLTPAIYLAHHLIDSYLGKSLANQLKEEASR